MAEVDGNALPCCGIACCDGLNVTGCHAGDFILGAVKLCHLWRGYKAPARASAPRKLSVLSMVYLALECTF